MSARRKRGPPPKIPWRFNSGAHCMYQDQGKLPRGEFKLTILNALRSISTAIIAPVLDFGYNPLTDTVLPHLKKMTSPTALQITGAQMSPELFEELSKTLPDRGIEFLPTP